MIGSAASVVTTRPPPPLKAGASLQFPPPKSPGGAAVPILTRQPSPKPVPIKLVAGTVSPPSDKVKPYYQSVAVDKMAPLSFSPSLQPSASMVLLDKTAEVLRSGERLSHMAVESTTTVFEVRKAPKKGNMHRERSLLAVFKPTADAGHVESSILTGEERALRERAAYLLDKASKGFSHVPATALAKVYDQEGSLQAYIRSDGSAEDNPLLVSKASAEAVQRIGILDCRIFNLDRHAGNVLVKKIMSKGISPPLRAPTPDDDTSVFSIGGSEIEEDDTDGVEMTPIDHGLSLPSWCLLDGAFFDWSFWPQAKAPFSEKAVAHIESLDPLADAQLLRGLGIPEACVTTNRLATVFLKQMVHGGLTLHDLGVAMQRPYPCGHKLHDLPSVFEVMVDEACAKVGVDRQTFAGLPDEAPPDRLFAEFEKLVEAHVESGQWREWLR